MMSSDWLKGLARYNRWMNDKVYGAASTLSDETRKRDCGAFFKSIHGTLNHLLVADRIWMGRFKGSEFPPPFIGPGAIVSIDQELYSDFEELRRQRGNTDEEICAWIEQLHPEKLSAPLVFIRRGKRFEHPLWWAVSHLFNHQTHHRGQVTTLLTQNGADPGVTDLFAMFIEEAAPRPRA